MVGGTWIILAGAGGDLDRVFIREDDNISYEAALHDAIVDQRWQLAPGDSIRFEEGESEID